MSNKPSKKKPLQYQYYSLILTYIHFFTPTHRIDKFADPNVALGVLHTLIFLLSFNPLAALLKQKNRYSSYSSSSFFCLRYLDQNYVHFISAGFCGEKSRFARPQGAFLYTLEGVLLVGSMFTRFFFFSPLQSANFLPRRFAVLNWTSAGESYDDDYGGHAYARAVDTQRGGLVVVGAKSRCTKLLSYSTRVGYIVAVYARPHCDTVENS